ncbi:MAG: ABC transporter ATP-binding protein [Chloroflexota bacterium]|nr:ABC transporter ATP-binding protein [Chloroflexota bacterium]
MIELDNINKVYRMGHTEVLALRRINCHIEHGEMISIMGHSGSGKSTLMNLIGCLDRPTSGKYYLEGVEVNKLNDNKLAEIRNNKIGFVFQSFNLLPRVSALANVEIPLIYSGIRSRRQRALQVLESVGLAHRAKHKPTEMAGGEQQRVAIARALVNNPSIILADEPTGNLDTQTSKEIMLLLQQLNRQGITIILVTHEPDIATYTQRTIRIRDGQIEASA